MLFLCVVFARRRDQLDRSHLRKAKLLGVSLAHEMRSVFHSTAIMDDVAHQVFKEKGMLTKKNSKEYYTYERKAVDAFAATQQKHHRVLRQGKGQLELFTQFIRSDSIEEEQLQQAPIDQLLQQAVERFALFEIDPKLRVTLHAGEPFSVRVVEELFIHVLLNLMKNSAQAAIA